MLFTEPEKLTRSSEQTYQNNFVKNDLILEVRMLLPFLLRYKLLLFKCTSGLILTLLIYSMSTLSQIFLRTSLTNNTFSFKPSFRCTIPEIDTFIFLSLTLVARSIISWQIWTGVFSYFNHLFQYVIQHAQRHDFVK